MGTRKSIKNRIIDYTGTGVNATIAFAGVAFVANRYFGYDVDWTLPIVAGFGGTALVRMLDRYPASRAIAVTTGHTKTGRHIIVNGQPGFFSSIQRWVGNRPEIVDERDIYSRTVRYKEPPRREFYWDVSLPKLAYTVRVRETVLLTLVLAARKRQVAGNPYIFSRNYFTRSYRPKFSVSLYNACMAILEGCELIENRDQGRSGFLIYPPHSTVELAKDWYHPI